MMIPENIHFDGIPDEMQRRAFENYHRIFDDMSDEMRTEVLLITQLVNDARLVYSRKEDRALTSEKRLVNSGTLAYLFLESFRRLQEFYGGVTDEETCRRIDDTQTAMRKKGWVIDCVVVAANGDIVHKTAHGMLTEIKQCHDGRAAILATRKEESK